MKIKRDDSESMVIPIIQPHGVNPPATEGGSTTICRPLRDGTGVNAHRARCTAIALILGLSGMTVIAEPLVTPAPTAATDEETGIVRLAGAWELSGPLVWVWPERISGRRGWVERYTAVLGALPTDIDVALAGTRPPAERAMAALGRPARYLHAPRVQDIWIADWAGWPGVDAEGRLVRVLADHVTDRYSARDRRRAEEDRAAGRALAEQLYGRTVTMPLRLNPLQLAHNGDNLALVSHRVIHQNEHLTLDELRQALRRYMGFSEIIFFPPPPGEPDGRIAGVVRFVSPTHLLLAQPAPDSDMSSQAYLKSVRGLLRERLPAEMEILTVPRATGAAADAHGSYLNLIAIGRTLWLPSFDQPTDEVVHRYLSDALPGYTVSLLPHEALVGAAADGIILDRLHAHY